MAKSNSQRVREAEAKRRERGEKEYRIWAPSTEDSARRIHELVDTLRQEARDRKLQQES
jgi:hypothetical protein